MTKDPDIAVLAQTSERVIIAHFEVYDENIRSLQTCVHLNLWLALCVIFVTFLYLCKFFWVRYFFPNARLSQTYI